MRLGLFCLLLGYVLSQFYRAFLAVLSPALQADLGMEPGMLARASGFWFLGFALFQLPVGWGLDRIGPRLTTSVLLGIGGGGGALLFSLATAPWMIQAAMILIGIGCAPVLMGSYFILAREFPPRLFATLGGILVGVGSIGNLASALPLAWAVDAFGWRATVFTMSFITLGVAASIAAFVKNPVRIVHEKGHGSFMEVLRLPGLWLVLPLLFVAYAPSGGIRGLWIGPFMGTIHGLDENGIGRITLVMALAMVAANFVYAPLDRVFGTRKWVILGGSVLLTGCLLVLGLVPGRPLWLDAALFAGVGFFGSFYAVQMAHGRAFLPPHLTGRGVALLNLFSIGGVGVFQFFSGRLFAVASAHTATSGAAYSVLFLSFAAFILIGCAFFLFCEDRTN